MDKRTVEKYKRLRNQLFDLRLKLQFQKEEEKIKTEQEINKIRKEIGHLMQEFKINKMANKGGKQK